MGLVYRPRFVIKSCMITHTHTNILQQFNLVCLLYYWEFDGYAICNRICFTFEGIPFVLLSAGITWFGLPTKLF